MTEATEVENPVVRWAKKRRIRSRKMNGLGQRGWPDRMFCLPSFPFWIEFKLPDEELEPLQIHIINELLELGYDIEVHDNPQDAISAIERRLEAAQLSKERGKVYVAERGGRVIPRPRTRQNQHNASRHKNTKKGKAGK